MEFLIISLIIFVESALYLITRYDILRTRETREPGGLPFIIGGANPPDERKEGVANVCYIL